MSIVSNFPFDDRLVKNKNNKYIVGRKFPSYISFLRSRSEATLKSPSLSKYHDSDMLLCRKKYLHHINEFVRRDFLRKTELGNLLLPPSSLAFACLKSFVLTIFFFERILDILLSMIADRFCALPFLSSSIAL